MPLVRYIQPSFAGGEISPTLAGRVDQQKFHSSVETLLNFVPQAHGGADNRAGTKFVVEALGQCRLIPFEYSVVQAYVLEFTNGYIRVLRNGALVLNQLVDSARYKWTASGSGTNEYYLDLLAGGDPGIAEPLYVSENGADMTAGTAGSLAVGEWDWGDNDTLGYDTVYVRLTDEVDPDTKADGYLYTDVLIASPYSFADLTKLRFTQSADQMYIAHNDHTPRVLTRTSHMDWTLSEFVIAQPTMPNNPTAVLTGTSTAPYRTYTYVVTQVDANGRESAVSATPASVNVTTPWAAGDYVTVSWNMTADAERYVVYKNSRGFYGYAGEVEQGAYPGTLDFVDDNIDPDTSDTAPGTEIFNATAADDRPGAVGIFQQRLFFGRSNDEPQTIWASSAGRFDDFVVSRPARADQGFAAQLASTRVNEIRHLVPIDRLVLLTAGGEWVADGGSSSAAITPGSINFRPQGYNGASDVPPVVVNDTVLFVDRSGQVVRDLRYAFETDSYGGNNLTVFANHLFDGHSIKEWGYQQYPGSVIWAVRDDGLLLSFTYLREHQVWAWARHNTTSGLFDSVAAVPTTEGSSEVYFSVKRTINSVEKYYIEQLQPRLTEADDMEDAWFVDSGLDYDGAAATVFSGLDHLEGETVSVLADGNAYMDLAVSSGQVTLPSAHSRVIIGLPYASDLGTLSLDVPSERGSAQGDLKCVREVTLKVANSRGASVGPGADKLFEIKWRQDELYGNSTDAFTGDKRIAIEPASVTEARVFVRQTYPLPLSVLALVADIDV